MLLCETEIHFYDLKKILCEGVLTFEKHLTKTILFSVVYQLRCFYYQCVEVLFLSLLEFVFTRVK